MNSRILSVGVFVTLMLSALLAGHHGYCGAKEELRADLNQALLRTLEERQGNIVTQDSIRAYKQLRKASGGPVLLAIADKQLCRNLKNEKLRQRTFLSFAVIDAEHPDKPQGNDILSSDTLIINHKATGTTLAIRSYARFSTAAVFSMSDQRLSLLLAFAALLWAIGSCLLHHKRQTGKKETQSFGGISYSAEEHCFYDVDHTPIRLTPMQYQLLLMLWQAPSHSLSKEAICASLWPKKDDATDTLYTLIRRLKPVIERSSGLRIIAYRGQSYALEAKEIGDCQDNVRKMSAPFSTYP